MFTRNRVTLALSGTTRRNKPGRSQRPRCVLPTGTSCRQDFQRNLAPADAGDGVSTYLALTFGTLLSSQGTDASFGFPFGFPPGASLRCFTLYQGFSGLSNHCFSAGMQKLVI